MNKITRFFLFGFFRACDFYRAAEFIGCDCVNADTNMGL